MSKLPPHQCLQPQGDDGDCPCCNIGSLQPLAIDPFHIDSWETILSIPRGLEHFCTITCTLPCDEL